MIKELKQLKKQLLSKTMFHLVSSLSNNKFFNDFPPCLAPGVSPIMVKKNTQIEQARGNWADSSEIPHLMKNIVRSVEITPMSPLWFWPQTLKMIRDVSMCVRMFDWSISPSPLIYGSSSKQLNLYK